MSDRPIAYVMEQTLGSVTHYLNLRREESPDYGGQRWLPITYRSGRLPWTVTASWAARKAMHSVLPEVDGVFMHTTTLAPLCIDYFKRKPTILSTDATPFNKRMMRADYGLKPEGQATERAKRALYRKVFANAAGFVAWSNWAKASFVEDYGCRPEDVAVIPPGIDLAHFSQGDRSNELPRLLFVGGDFVRKGGDLLLDVFRRRLKGRAELTIVTRDRVAEEPGVSVHHDVRANSEELTALYRSSDVFVLPTRADCYSLVCMEALAAGLPIVATNVGGIPDVIHEGETGYLIDPDDGQTLGDALEALVDDPARRHRMGDSGRKDALERFGARENARKLFEFVRSRC
jgi:glycosyltransferase involved in cell wall biosynthesis